jgi:hypothetical protein
VNLSGTFDRNLDVDERWHAAHTYPARDRRSCERTAGTNFRFLLLWSDFEGESSSNQQFNISQ